MSESKSYFNLKGKVAVVTGAMGLLGQHHCLALSNAGANVVVTDLDEVGSRDFASHLPNKSLGIGADITSENDVTKLKQKVMDKFGKIDILVNNAAINDMIEKENSNPEMSKFENYSVDSFRAVIEVNVIGMFNCSKILGSVMAQNNYGSIINIASTYGIVAPDQSLYLKPDGSRSFYKSPAYPTSKGAVISFTKYLAAYWGEKGVRVNCLTPGGVDNNQEEYFNNNYSKRTPLKRMAIPEDYHGAVIFLASDASAYMTGANLVVDGGWTIW